MAEQPNELERCILVAIRAKAWSGEAAVRTITIDPERNAEVYKRNQLRLIDRSHLKVFDALKKQAEYTLAQYGFKLEAGGTVVPEEVWPELEQKMIQLQSSYSEAASNFLDGYRDAIDTWISQNPDDESIIRRHIPTFDAMQGKFDLIWLPAEIMINNPEYERYLESLGSELHLTMAKEAAAAATKCLLKLGKSKRKRFVGMKDLQRVAKKVRSLVFVRSETAVLADTLDHLIESVNQASYGEDKTLTSASMMTLESLLRRISKAEDILNLGSMSVAVESNAGTTIMVGAARPTQLPTSVGRKMF